MRAKSWLVALFCVATSPSMAETSLDRVIEPATYNNIGALMADISSRSFAAGKDQGTEEADKLMRQISRQFMSNGLAFYSTINVEKLAFGKTATVNISIENVAKEGLWVDEDKISISIPEELKVSDAWAVRRTSESFGQRYLDPGSTMRISYAIEPCGQNLCLLQTFIKALTFSPSDKYSISLQVDARMEYDSVDHEDNNPIVNSASFNIPVHMPAIIIAIISALGAMMAAYCLHGVEVLIIRKTNFEFIDIHYARKEIRKRRRDTATLASLGAIFAFVLAPLLSLAAESPTILSIKIVDVWGALAIGFLIYFVVYERQHPLGLRRLFSSALAK